MDLCVFFEIPSCRKLTYYKELRAIFIEKRRQGEAEGRLTDTLWEYIFFRINHIFDKSAAIFEIFKHQTIKNLIILIVEHAHLIDIKFKNYIEYYSFKFFNLKEISSSLFLS